MFDQVSYNKSNKSPLLKESSPMYVTNNSSRVTIARGADEGNMVSFDPIEPATFDAMMFKPEDVAQLLLHE